MLLEHTQARRPRAITYSFLVCNVQFGFNKWLKFVLLMPCVDPPVLHDLLKGELFISSAKGNTLILSMSRKIYFQHFINYG